MNMILVYLGIEQNYLGTFAMFNKNYCFNSKVVFSCFVQVKLNKLVFIQQVCVLNSAIIVDKLQHTYIGAKMCNFHYLLNYVNA